jgi:hypothetical protein
MILEDISRQLDNLYCTNDLSDGISIGTHISFEGDRINFCYQQEDEKYARIVTNRNFSEWMAWCTGNWKAAAPMIEQLAKPYGVQWDNEEGALFFRFRRNEITIAQAVLRLQQAVFVIGALKNVQ